MNDILYDRIEVGGRWNGQFMVDERHKYTEGDAKRRTD